MKQYKKAAVELEKSTIRFINYSSRIVHDILKEMSQTNFTAIQELRSIVPEKALAGSTFKINGKVKLEVYPHNTFLEWIGLLIKVLLGYIRVCRPNDTNVGHLVELSLETLQA